MPVWGLWDDGALFFSSGGRSRKVENLTADARCVVAIADTTDPALTVRGNRHGTPRCGSAPAGGSG